MRMMRSLLDSAFDSTAALMMARVTPSFLGKRPTMRFQSGFSATIFSQICASLSSSHVSALAISTPIRIWRRPSLAWSCAQPNTSKNFGVWGL